jgi:hypothetical protein
MNEPFDISMHSHPLWQALLKYSELHDELQELIKVNTAAETSKGEVTEK